MSLVLEVRRFLGFQKNFILKNQENRTHVGNVDCRKNTKKANNSSPIVLRDCQILTLLVSIDILNAKPQPSFSDFNASSHAKIHYTTLMTVSITHNNHNNNMFH